MRKQNSAFKAAFTSEADKNLKNTDSFGYVELDKYTHYIIANGVDDRADGMSAKLVVGTIISAFIKAPSMRKETLRRYLRSVDKALLTTDSKMRLKASVTVIMTDYVEMWYGRAGNACFRLHRDGFFRAQSRDQSLNMNLVKVEKLEPDELIQHQERHDLYCYLGQDKGSYPFIPKKLKLPDSDMAALMTWGVQEHLGGRLLKDASADAPNEPQEAVDTVEDLLLSMQPKDLDTYTLVVIFFNRTYNDSNRKRKIERVIIVAIPIILVPVVVAAVLAVYSHSRQKKTDSIKQSFYNMTEYVQADNYVQAKEECQKALNLAKDLSDKEIQEDAEDYMKPIRNMIAGDDTLAGGEYSDARRNLLNARDCTRYAGDLGLDYIDNRPEQASQYMSAYELISLDDTFAQGQQYNKAGEQYPTAEVLAAQLYSDTGRNDTMAALRQMYTDQLEQQVQENERAQETAQVQTAAVNVLAKDGTAFSKGGHEGARAFYTAILQKYTELEDQAQIDATNVKLAAVDNKLPMQTGLAAEVEGYIRQTESQYVDKNYAQAKKYYLLAENVYAELKDDNEVSGVTRKLELIEMGISEEERAAREAKEATKAAEKARQQATGGSTEPASSETFQSEAIG